MTNDPKELQRKKVAHLLDKKMAEILKILNDEEVCCICHDEPMEFPDKFLAFIRDIIDMFQSTIGDLNEGDIRFILNQESEPKHTLH